MIWYKISDTGQEHPGTVADSHRPLFIYLSINLSIYLLLLLLFI